MGFRVAVKIVGLEQFQKGLAGLKESIQKRVLRAAMRKSASIINKSAKSMAPTRTGQLRRSLGVVVKAYPSGVVVGIVEPRKEFRIVSGSKAIDPRKYAHLVERGTKPHSVGRGSNLRRRAQSGRLHPGARAQPFLGPAFTMNQAGIVAAFESELDKMLAKL